VIRVERSAYALTLFRILPSGEGRMYTIATFRRDPWRGCDRTIRMGLKVGWLADPSADGYGVLDVLDEDDNIVQDFTVTTSQAFRQLKRRLGLRVEHEH
jgi:hypothetical protein